MIFGIGTPPDGDEYVHTYPCLVSYYIHKPIVWSIPFHVLILSFLIQVQTTPPRYVTREFSASSPLLNGSPLHPLSSREEPDMIHHFLVVLFLFPLSPFEAQEHAVGVSPKSPGGVNVRDERGREGGKGGGGRSQSKRRRHAKRREGGEREKGRICEGI